MFLFLVSFLTACTCVCVCVFRDGCTRGDILVGTRWTLSFLWTHFAGLHWVSGLFQRFKRFFIRTKSLHAFKKMSCLWVSALTQQQGSPTVFVGGTEFFFFRQKNHISFNMNIWCLFCNTVEGRIDDKNRSLINYWSITDQLLHGGVGCLDPVIGCWTSPG